MKRTPPQSMVILTPKNDKGKAKLAHHGEKWKCLGVQDGLKFSMDESRHMRLISRDGSKLIFVKECDDPDFESRFV